MQWVSNLFHTKFHHAMKKIAKIKTISEEIERLSAPHVNEELSLRVFAVLSISVELIPGGKSAQTESAPSDFSAWI